MTWGGCFQQGARLERWVGQAELSKRHFEAAPDLGRRLSEQRSPRAMSVGAPLWTGMGGEPSGLAGEQECRKELIGAQM